jgi:tetratricopeptide (TPR) repeat protein
MTDDPQTINFRLPGIDACPTSVERLSQAVAAQPNNAELHCDLAITFQNAGQLERAVQQYRSAVEIDPSLRRAWYNLGCLYNSEGREGEAVVCFRRSIELEPQHAPSNHNLGQALFNLGDTDAAIEQYRRAISLGAKRLSATMLAMTIAVSPSADPATILSIRREWAERYLPKPLDAASDASASEPPSAVCKKTSRRLRCCLLRSSQLDEAGLGAYQSTQPRAL